MEDKRAVKILIALLKKEVLNNEEKEAVESAIGIMTWTSLGASRIKKMKDKKDKAGKW